MKTTQEIKRERERHQFHVLFALGDEMNSYLNERGCSIADACRHYMKTYDYTMRGLDAIVRTARAFPPTERNESVGFTKHQALAEVSRDRLPLACSDSQYRLALREALTVIRDRQVRVNALNSKGGARDILIECVRRVCLL